MVEQESLGAGIQQQVAFTRDYQDLGLGMTQWQDIQEIGKKAVSQLNLSSVIVDLDFAGLEVKADPLLSSSTSWKIPSPMGKA